MTKLIWTDSVKDEVVSYRVKEERNIRIMKKGRLTGLVTSHMETTF